MTTKPQDDTGEPFEAEAPPIRKFVWNLNAHNEVGDIFISPEARHQGCTEPLPKRPPVPWNPEIVRKPVYMEGRGPSELPPDRHNEWMNSGELVQAGGRRYSHYDQFGNRDGPQLAFGLHPSRSSLRPLNSSHVRTLGARSLEAKGPPPPKLHLGAAAEGLECRANGPALVMQHDGAVRKAVGHMPPGGRPFSGYRSTVFRASGILEGNRIWSDQRLEKKRIRLDLGGDKRKSVSAMSERMMDDIVAEFEGSGDSTPLGSSSDEEEEE